MHHPAGSDNGRPRWAVRVGPAVAVGLIAAVVPTASTDAYTLFGTGCRYDPGNDDDGLGIGIRTDDPQYSAAGATAFENAAYGWNQVVTPQFTMVGYGGSTRDLRAEFADLGANTGGLTSIWCGSSWYSQDPLTEFGTNATYYTANLGRRTAVLEHEEGHSYGLNHNDTTGCDTKTAGVMFYAQPSKYDECGWNVPTTDDVNGQIDAHNG